MEHRAGYNRPYGTSSRTPFAYKHWYPALPKAGLAVDRTNG